MNVQTNPLPDVVVVGAGVGGLCAAVRLAKAGARVCVLEAKAVIGGRASSFRDPQTGDRVDNGQHVLVGGYRETFEFLRMLGTADRVWLQPNLDVEFVDQQNVRSRLRCPSLPPPMHLLAGLLDWDAISWRDRVAATQLAPAIRVARQVIDAQARGQRSPLAAASPGETVEQWLINNGQTARLREMLWDPLALAALNQSPKEAAAPPFARVLAQMFGGEPREAALGLPSVPLDDLFADPARRFIEERGGEIRVGAAATIVLEDDRVSHVEVRGERLAVPLVVCAVPWYVLPEIFAGNTSLMAPIQQAAAATAASPIVSVNLWLDRPALRTPFLGLPGRTFQWVFDKEQLFKEVATSHVTLVSSGASAIIGETNEACIEVALRELRNAMPDTRAARVLRASVVRERRATFSLAPGQPRRPATATPIWGLFLASDWVDTGLPATIESAVLSGRLAADALS